LDLRVHSVGTFLPGSRAVRHLRFPVATGKTGVRGAQMHVLDRHPVDDGIVVCRPRRPRRQLDLLGGGRRKTLCPKAFGFPKLEPGIREANHLGRRNLLAGSGRRQLSGPSRRSVHLAAGGDPHRDVRGGMVQRRWDGLSGTWRETRFTSATGGYWKRRTPSGEFLRCQTDVRQFPSQGVNC